MQESCREYGAAPAARLFLRPRGGVGFAAFAVAALLCAFLCLCGPSGASCRDTRFVAADPGRFVDDMDCAGIERAARAGLAYLARSSRKSFPLGMVALEKEQLAAGLSLLLRLRRQYPSSAGFIAAVRREFVFLRPEGKSRVLVTGYYQPEFPASAVKTGEYRYPLYGVPRDLVTLPDGRAGRMVNGALFPYPPRAEIDARGLATAPVLAWMRDPVEAFIVHVQGSAVLDLAGGGTMRVAYAARNGRPYRSIGAWLVETGRMRREEVTMPAIVSYLKEHPDEVGEVLSRNESYIFFRKARGPAAGSLGEPLVPGRSAALDQGCYPPGAPLFLVSRRPLVDADGSLNGFTPMRRLVFNHDSGSAIRGACRLDLYMGEGKRAGTAAGVMRHPGRIFVLVPRAVVPGKNLRLSGANR